MRAIDFFKLFWTHNITQIFAEQTNLCSVQEQGKNISTCAREIEQFLGMHIDGYNETSRLQFVLGSWDPLS